MPKHERLLCWSLLNGFVFFGEIGLDYSNIDCAKIRTFLTTVQLIVFFDFLATHPTEIRPLVPHWPEHSRSPPFNYRSILLMRPLIFAAKSASSNSCCISTDKNPAAKAIIKTVLFSSDGI
ncbi:hypothetical protein Zmor_013287 [Zophobas morio]|uniref:Uncharacterized protein n=1 Tax=Zophobas morio TaxID=2755281 RepID=A0AA38II37_9CUCU|nr:hypothetical protein Zmor_013287 [Zophobas morio]